MCSAPSTVSPSWDRSGAVSRAAAKGLCSETIRALQLHRGRWVHSPAGGPASLRVGARGVSSDPLLQPCPRARVSRGYGEGTRVVRGAVAQPAWDHPALRLAPPSL